MTLSRGTLPESESPHLSIHVDPRTLMKCLATIILMFVVMSTVAHTFLGAVGENDLRGLRQVAMRFDMDRENTLPEWFSSLLLASCCFMLANIGLHCRRTGQPFAWHWLVLSATFLYLSMDESAGLHEILMVPLRRRLNATGIFYFSWVIVAFPLVLAMFIAYLRFFGSLVSRYRWLFISAGCIYVGGALGMELIGGALAESSGFYTVAYTVAMTIEESLEMIGASLFLCALIDYRLRLPVQQDSQNIREKSVTALGRDLATA